MKAWIPTVPGKNWFAYFRFYQPTEPYFDRSWPLTDFEQVQSDARRGNGSRSAATGSAGALARHEREARTVELSGPLEVRMRGVRARAPALPVFGLLRFPASW